MALPDRTAAAPAAAATAAAVPVSATALRHRLLHDLDTLSAACTDGRWSSSRIHELRKALKRARTLLALLEPALRREVHAALDDALRNAGRSLAAARDAAVLVQTHARVRRSLAARGRHPGSSTVASRRGTRLSSPPVDAATARDCIDRARAQLVRAKLRGRGWTPLGRAVHAIHRAGRRRMPEREGRATGDELHAWRKRVKRYCYLLETFVPVAPARLGPLLADAQRLSHLLGREHDLALLAAWLESPRGPRAADDARVLEAISRRRALLARQALRLGARLYADRSGVAERRLRADWERWRRRPRAASTRRSAG